jgi:hypothetical protein
LGPTRPLRHPEGRSPSTRDKGLDPRYLAYGLSITFG